MHACFSFFFFGSALFSWDFDLFFPTLLVVFHLMRGTCKVDLASSHPQVCREQLNLPLPSSSFVSSEMIPFSAPWVCVTYSVSSLQIFCRQSTACVSSYHQIVQIFNYLCSRWVIFDSRKYLLHQWFSIFNFEISDHSSV